MEIEVAPVLKGFTNVFSPPSFIYKIISLRGRCLNIAPGSHPGGGRSKYKDKPNPTALQSPTAPITHILPVFLRCFPYSHACHFGHSVPSTRGVGWFARSWWAFADKILFCNPALLFRGLFAAQTQTTNSVPSLLADGNPAMVTPGNTSGERTSVFCMSGKASRLWARDKGWRGHSRTAGGMQLGWAGGASVPCPAGISSARRPLRSVAPMPQPVPFAPQATLAHPTLSFCLGKRHLQ